MSKLKEFLESEGVELRARKLCVKARRSEMGEGIITKAKFWKWAALNPPVQSLSEMFDWSKTSEGSEYWSDMDGQARAYCGLLPLGEELEKQFEDRRAWDNPYKVLMALGYLQEAIDELLSQNEGMDFDSAVDYMETALSPKGLFNFQISQKGAEFWNNVNSEFLKYNNITEMEVMAAMFASVDL